MSIRIFLADDHMLVRDGLRFILEAQKDMEIVGEASNGRETIDLVRQLRPDVVVLDIAMPEMNGIEAAEQIRSTCQETKVVILSMHSTSEHIYRALRAGAKGYLLKESAGKEVVDAIRTVSNGQRFLSHKITNLVVEDYINLHENIPAKSPLELLSSREREILQLVVEGKSSPEIAEILFISPKTVDSYRSRVMQKLYVKDITGLVKFAIKHNVTSSE
jgi:two-component system, NarL family, response regulator NreC